MTGRTRFFTLVGGCLLIVMVLTWQATKTTASLVLTPTELLASGHHDRARLRMGGRVAAEGLSYATSPEFRLAFRLEDRENPERSVPVVFLDVKPDMFAPGRDVLVDGDWKDGTFHAAHLLTQCPSKYEPALPTTTSQISQ